MWAAALAFVGRASAALASQSTERELRRGPEAEAGLKAEVSELRLAPPSFLLLVEGPLALRQVALAGKLHGPDDPEGPWWAVDFVLRGPVGSPYQGQHRARVTVDSTWPKTPPLSARLVSNLDHLYVDPEDSGELRVPLGWLFAAEGGGAGVRTPRHALRAGVARLHFALGAPLSPLDAEAEEAWRARAEAQAARGAAAAAYAPWRARPLLYAGGWLEESWLDSRLTAALREDAIASSPAVARRPSAVRRLAAEVLPGVFEVPAFAPELRDALRAELDGFLAAAPKLGIEPRRPNNHHRYGAVAGDVGLEPFMLELLRRVVAPLARELFPLEGAELDGQHSFFVRYRRDQDRELDSHHDDSDVTFNVALGADGAEGAQLHFCGLVGDPDHRQWRSVYRHRPGYAVLHLGRHRHGVATITAGERQGLILWGRSSAWRRVGQGSYQRESGPPDPRCLSYTHDSDYGAHRAYPPGKEEAGLGAWCPPTGFEHVAA